MDIKDATISELEKELQRRKFMAAKPPPFKTPDWSKLQQFVEDGTKQLANEGSWPKAFGHLVYEMALEAVYGPDIWPWAEYVRG